MIFTHLELLEIKASKGDSKSMMQLGDYYNAINSKISSVFTVNDFVKANSLNPNITLKESAIKYKNSEDNILYFNITEDKYLVLSAEAAKNVKSNNIYLSDCCIAYDKKTKSYGIVMPFIGWCMRIEVDYVKALRYYLNALSEGVVEAEEKILAIANNIKEKAIGIDTNYDFDTSLLYWVMSYDDAKLDFIRNKLMVALTSIPYNKESSADNFLFRNYQNQYCLKDHNGNIVVPWEKYDYIGYPARYISLVRKGGKFGLISKGGTEILPVIYDCISDFDNMDTEVITTSRNGKRETFNLINIFPQVEKNYIQPSDGYYDPSAYYGDETELNYYTNLEKMNDAYLDGEGNSSDYDL